MSSMNRGWYTAQTSKSGYVDSTFHVYSCGNVSSQDSSISTTMSSGAMRVILSWPTGSTAVDLDSHITGPDNASGRFHVFYDSKKKFYYAKNDYICSGCSASQMSDNVTLDRDEQEAPGTETVSITTVRSGTYRYSVFDFDNGETANNSSSTKLANSGASVTIYYNALSNALSNNPTVYNVQKGGGNLWTVFTFTTSGGLTEVGTMSYQTTPASIY
ncbi:MAG TPA: hypothetical protein EYN39_01180 [Deltaproteobacteria bacterium]|nr:hypothetical protein [Deltaproteobacteria bacterium]